MDEDEYRRRYANRLREKYRLGAVYAKLIANAADFDADDLDPEGHADDEVSYWASE